MKKNLLTVSAVCVALTVLQGCTAPKNCRAERDSAGRETGRMKCDIGSLGGKISTQIAQLNESDRGFAWLSDWLVGELMAQQVVPFTASSFDATLARMSTAGSTVPVDQNTGVFTLKLYTGSNLIAATSFSWIRSGTDLILQNPAAVNTWARQHPAADGYALNGDVAFAATSQPTVTIAHASVYNGVTAAASTQTYSSPRSGSNIKYAEQ
jgi:hypothetical protein